MGAAEIEIDLGESAPSYVGRYRICGEIASGGMASVYLAMCEGSSPGARRADASGSVPVTSASALCAIKRVHPHLARQREFVEMFVDEARIASRIRHPNVCGVLEWGETDGTFFLAMELLSGEPLVALLRRLKTRPEILGDPRWHRVAARIVADACAGLHAAHELPDDDGEPMHVVHRDVSPHNLFVTWEGATKVVDFGVASAKHRLHHTTTGTVKGKFAYMSPEQLQGATVDRRADVWALGVVLWELLAGRPLFRRTVETETIFAVLNETIPPLEKVRPGAPRALEDIARRAMTSDLERRTATAELVRQDLEAWIAAQGGCDAGEVAAMIAELLPGQRESAAARIERALAGATTITPSRHPEPTPPTGAKISGVQRKAERRSRSISALVIASVALVAIGSVSAWQLAPTLGLLETGSQDLSVGPPEESLAASGSEPISDDAIDRAAEPGAPIDPGAIDLRSTALASPAAPDHPAPDDPTPDLDPAPASDTVPAPAIELAAPPPHVHRETRARATVSQASAGRVGARAPAAAAPDPDDDGSGVGELDVATPGGWAEVWLDGVRLGHTPGRFHLPVGRHTLVLRPGDGGEPHEARVRIVGGQLARLRVDLSR